MIQEEEKILKDYKNELYKECSKIEDRVDRMNFLIGIPAKLQQKQKMLFIKRVVLKYAETDGLYDFEKDEIDMERTMKSAFVHYTEEFVEIFKWEYEANKEKYDGYKNKQNVISATGDLITFCKFLKYMRTNHPEKYSLMVTGLWSFSLDNIIYHAGEYYYKFHTDEWDGTNDIVSVEKINNVKL